MKAESFHAGAVGKHTISLKNKHINQLTSGKRGFHNIALACHHDSQAFIKLPLSLLTPLHPFLQHQQSTTWAKTTLMSSRRNYKEPCANKET